MQMAKTRKRKGAGRALRRDDGKGPFAYERLPEMEWIAIRRDEIVAHASTLKELDAMVKQRPDREFVVFSRVFPRRPAIW
jgi:hypothetical protein